MGYLGTKPANSPLTSELIPDGIITPADLSQGKPVWDTSGNVGIGTASPTDKLDVRGAIRATGAFGMKGNVSGNPMMLDVQDQSGNTVIEIGRADNVSSLVAMDFHTGSTSTDYDVRIIASGGNGTSGNGILTYAASRVDFNGNLFFNSGYGSAALAYGCRAWVNFNGTGTVAIRASGNVTSITDNGTGVYTINFTTAMPDDNYAVAGFGNWIDNSNANGVVTARATSTKSTTALQVFTTNSTQAWAGIGAVDLSQISVSIFR